MSLERCVHQGHDFHEPDGAVFVRHKQRTPGLVTVVCCWCERTAELEAYAKAPPPSETSYTKREHGPFVPGSRSADAIARQSDEALLDAMLANERDAALYEEKVTNLAAEGRTPETIVALLGPAPEATAKAAVLSRMADLRKAIETTTADGGVMIFPGVP